MKRFVRRIKYEQVNLFGIILLAALVITAIGTVYEGSGGPK